MKRVIAMAAAWMLVLTAPVFATSTVNPAGEVGPNDFRISRVGPTETNYTMLASRRSLMTDLTSYFRHTLTQGNADSEFTWSGAGPDWIPVLGNFGLD